jgi:hypothetical protein
MPHGFILISWKRNVRKTLGWACVLAWAALCLRAGAAEADAKKTGTSAKTSKTGPKKKAAPPFKAVGKTGKKAPSSGKTGPKTAPKATSAGRTAAPASAGAKTPAKTAGKSPAKTAGKKGASKRGKQTPRVTWRNRQAEPTPERYKEIQSALAAKGFLDPADASGTWGQNSVDALKKFQAAQNIEVTGKINSLSLIALGLGPKRETGAKVPEAQPAQPH